MGIFRIKGDAISEVFTVLAVILTLYLSVVAIRVNLTAAFILVFPIFMLLSSLALSERYLEDSDPQAEVTILRRKSLNILFFTLIALAGVSVGAVISRDLYVPKLLLNSLTLTPYQARIYGVLMAVSEEHFFRRFLFQYLYRNIRVPFLAMLASAGSFMVYHFGVYGSVDLWIYVLIAGFVLAWVAYRSQKLAPCIIAHSIINIMAV